MSKVTTYICKSDESICKIVFKIDIALKYTNQNWRIPIHRHIEKHQGCMTEAEGLSFHLHLVHQPIFRTFLQFLTPVLFSNTRKKKKKKKCSLEVLLVDMNNVLLFYKKYSFNWRKFFERMAICSIVVLSVLWMKSIWFSYS